LTSIWSFFSRVLPERNAAPPPPFFLLRLDTGAPQFLFPPFFPPGDKTFPWDETFFPLVIFSFFSPTPPKTHRRNIFVAPTSPDAPPTTPTSNSLGFCSLKNHLLHHLLQDSFEGGDSPPQPPEKAYSKLPRVCRVFMAPTLSFPGKPWEFPPRRQFVSPTLLVPELACHSLPFLSVSPLC